MTATTAMADEASRCGPTEIRRTMSRFMRKTASTKSMPVTKLASPIPPPLGPPKNGHRDASPSPLPLYRRGCTARNSGRPYERVWSAMVSPAGRTSERGEDPWRSLKMPSRLPNVVK